MFRPGNARKWILIVDDDADIRDSLKELISDHFGEALSIVESPDGVDAIGKINHQNFDCILTDLDMPRKEGGSFIKAVRANAYNNLTPIIIVSGSDDKEKVSESYDFVYLVPKPFKSDELMGLIDNQIQIGGNKNRVSAEVLNNLIRSLIEFVSEMSNQELGVLGTPQIKSPGEDFDGEFVSSIRVKIGEVTNSFSIVLKEAALKSLSESSEALTGKDSGQILKAMSFVVLKHVMDKSGLIQRSNFKANFINHEKKTLVEKSGVIVELGNESLKIKIFATTK